jgi:hypothetical protein
MNRIQHKFTLTEWVCWIAFMYFVIPSLMDILKVIIKHG